MKILKRLYRFLGSIQLAITLILSAAILVMVGTFLESQTGSHLYASQWIYGHALFGILLGMFFINILVSSLHRWPFRIRHIPFLITHLGLLMLIGGTIIKNYYGVQGSLSIVEGSGSKHLFLPNTQALYLAKKDQQDQLETQFAVLPTNKQPFTSLNTHFNDLKIRLLGYSPHSQEKFESWIKRDELIISGLPPIKVSNELVPHKFWNHYIYAVRTEHTPALAKKAYLANLTLTFTDLRTGELLYQGPLDTVKINHQPIPVELDWDNRRVEVDLTAYLGYSARLEISLQENSDLSNWNRSTSHLGALPIKVTCFNIPSLAVFQEHDLHSLFWFDAHGRISAQTSHNQQLKEYVSYERGFGGYYLQAKFPQYPNQLECFRQVTHQICEVLTNGLANLNELSPPLKLLKAACDKKGVSFPETCLAFLESWNNSNSWLFPEEMILTECLSTVLPALPWDQADAFDYYGSLWVTKLFEGCDQLLYEPNEFFQTLLARGWPLELQEGTAYDTLTRVTQQVFSLGKQLPTTSSQVLTAHQQAKLLSAFFRAYQLHLSQILPEKQVMPTREITLETPLTLVHKMEKPLQKLEDNRPLILLEFSQGNLIEKIALSYDPYGSSLKWPILNGSYLIRYQSLFQEIPYRVRLRNARQINYPHTNQPYSYESDLVIYRETGEELAETTISMNHVYETWDGYRFYLASMHPDSETEARHVQIVVNHDPAKYYLTYPGGVIVALGIGLLFWMRPYKKRKE